MAHASSAINILPDEILHAILYYIPPDDTLFNVRPVCKRFARISNEPLLWRHHCKTCFQFWDSRHRIRQKLAANIGDVDWKKLYCYRRNVDAQTTKTLGSIIASQTNRIAKFESIGKFGYDAKDSLLRHCRAEFSIEDALARRFYGLAVLDHIHRSKALEEWWRLSKDESISLERALGAFDMFVIHDQPGDLLEISDIFDSLAVSMREDCTNLDSFSPRQRALAVAHFLRANNLMGITCTTKPRVYRDLQNSYIGFALQDPDHPSLPLISVAIFCALAQRFGLNAHCCGFPSHVHAIVYPEVGKTMDGLQWTSTELAPSMYLDPWRSDDEVPVEHLRTQLVAYGIRPEDFVNFLGSTSPSNIVLRTSRNILATIQAFRSPPANTGQPAIRLHANPFADVDTAFYSAIWANFILYSSTLSPDRAMDANDLAQITPILLERFERLFPMDALLIERYVCPPSAVRPSGSRFELLETLRVVRAGDAMPKQVRTRRGIEDKMKHRIGQVFRHTRYGNSAVITGWELESSMNTEWTQTNRVDNPDSGRRQIFYRALFDDTSIRYVAEEYMEIITDVPKSLMSLAGRYFKRWDEEMHVFVSNIRDEFPDD